MKLAYVVRTEIPQRAAHTVHAMRMGEQFQRLADDFEMIVAQSEQTTDIQDEFAYYGVDIFRIHRIKKSKRAWMYAFACKAMARILKEKMDCVVTRDPLTALLCVLCHKRVVLDLHGEIAELCGRAYRMMKWDWFRYSKNLKLVMITKSLAEYYKSKYDLDSSVVTILPDGCTMEQFECCKEAPSLIDGKISEIGYIGKFNAGKGLKLVDTLARMDTERHYHLWGGDSDLYTEVCGSEPPANVMCHGYVANSEVAAKMEQCQVLLLPNQDVQHLTSEWDIGKVTSPIKMFEYMASGRIIVASDLPVLREILNDQICFFAEYSDAKAWKMVIDGIEVNYDDAVKKAIGAKELVRQYSWDERAKRMSEMLERK